MAENGAPQSAHPSTPHSRNILDQAATLASLSPLRLSWYQIKTISGAEVFVGGFGDVEKAEFRESLFLGANRIIALKRLRPSGDRAQRTRVIAVSALVLEPLVRP